MHGKDIEELLDGIIHSKTQVGILWVDLTVKEIHRLTKRGSLDFGGSEYCPAETVPLKAHKRTDDDKYGWWELRHGMYLIHYNETLNLPDNHTALITPHPRLIATGSAHSTTYLSQGEGLQSVLDIPQTGCALKENCRTSRLQVFKTTGAG
jgi:deoxycytidine triphosphate deaminase